MTSKSPRDTSKAMHDPLEQLLFLADGMTSGAAGAIEAQEAAGQPSNVGDGTTEATRDAT